MTFEQFASAHGLIVNRIESGRWMRVPTEDHPNKRNGAYFFDGDYAHVQNWATMAEVETWFMDKPMTVIDRQRQTERMEASRRKAATERAQQQRKAAEKAQGILAKCRHEKHAYLDSKGFPDAEGLVYWPEEKTNLLVIPMRVGSHLVGVQTIDVDGGKKFLFGQRCSGAEFRIGSIGLDVWVEGYATGLSTQAAIARLKMPHVIHVCFSAGNLEAMAKAAGRGVVIADNDISKAGEKAAIASGLRYFLPPDSGTDFNDFYRANGSFRASQALRSLLR